MILRDKDDEDECPYELHFQRHQWESRYSQPKQRLSGEAIAAICGRPHTIRCIRDLIVNAPKGAEAWKKKRGKERG